MRDRLASLQKLNKPFKYPPNSIRENLIEMTEKKNTKLNSLETRIMELVSLTQKNIKSIEKNCEILRQMSRVCSRTGDPTDERKVKNGVHKISENNFKYFSENKKILKELAKLKKKILINKPKRSSNLTDYQGLLRLTEFQLDGLFKLNELKMRTYLTAHREYEDLIKTKTIRRIRNIDPNLMIDSEGIGTT
jgi:hypothetical protein